MDSSNIQIFKNIFKIKNLLDLQSEKDNHHMVSVTWGILEIVKRIIRKKRGTEGEKLERETNHEKLLTLGSKGLQMGKWVGDGVTG